jgi:hypothetical protein
MLPLIFRPGWTGRFACRLGWYSMLVGQDWKSLTMKNIVAKEDVNV